MLKNFSPQALGINGRQSELIELALTYGFTGMDIDMHEMLRRSQRTNTEDAAKYLAAAKIKIGGFDLGVNLDADEDTFTSQIGGLHPLADLAKELGASRCYLRVPAATDRLPYHEYFDIQTNRLGQIAEVLSARDIRVGVGFSAGKELEEGKEFAFIRNVEGFLALVKAAGVRPRSAGRYLGLGHRRRCDGPAERIDGRAKSLRFASVQSRPTSIRVRPIRAIECCPNRRAP